MYELVVWSNSWPFIVNILKFLFLLSTHKYADWTIDDYILLMFPMSNDDSDSDEEFLILRYFSSNII